MVVDVQETDLSISADNLNIDIWWADNLNIDIWWMDIEMLMSLFAWAGIVIAILWIWSYILRSWWLYNINKKLWEPYPWLSWVPVIQMYSFVKAWWKSGMWILWIILWFMFLIIPGIVLVAMVCGWIAKRTDRWFWSAVWVFFVSPIMLPIIWYKLEDKTWLKPTESSPSNENLVSDSWEL